jgi:hypothetical protein
MSRLDIAQMPNGDVLIYSRRWKRIADAVLCFVPTLFFAAAFLSVSRGRFTSAA